MKTWIAWNDVKGADPKVFAFEADEDEAEAKALWLVGSGCMLVLWDDISNRAENKGMIVR